MALLVKVPNANTEAVEVILLDTELERISSSKLPEEFINLELDPLTSNR